MSERPSNWPSPDHPLLVAARYNDAEAEEHGLQGVIEKLGIDLPALEHISQQRRLRATAAIPNPSRAISILIEAAYFDGIAIGWRARSLEEGTDDDTA